MPLGKFFSFLTTTNTALSVGDLAFEITGLAADDGKPSAEGLIPGKDFRVFRMGENDSEKGTFTLTPQNAKKIDLAWKRRGVDCMLDYGHAVLNEDKGQPVPAMGWCKLEARPDGLWATEVKWTSDIAPMVKAGKIRYFSPLFEHTKNGEILSLANIAVTGVPASHGISPLSQFAAALMEKKSLADDSIEAPESQPGKPGGKPNVAENPAPVVIEATPFAKSPLSPEKKMTEDIMPDPASPNQGKAKTLSKLAQYLSDRMDDHDGEDLAKECGMRSDRMAEIKGGAEPTKEELSKLAKCLRVKESKLAALGVTVDEAPRAPQAPAGEAAPAPDEGNHADGDDQLEDSKPIQGLTALTALARKAGPEAEGVLLALVDSNKTVTALSRRLATIEKEKAESEVSATVSAAIRNGKITPAQKDWATELGRTSPKMLKSYLSVALPQGPGVAAFKEPASPAPSESDLDLNALRSYAESTGKSFEELKQTALEGLANDKKRLTALRAGR